MVENVVKYAHTVEGRNQTVKEHLQGVAGMSANFSNDMLRPLAYYLGMVHDIGKYATAFQNRLNGSNTKYEHSSCGAIEIKKLVENNKQLEELACILQYCVAGHHTGLPDGGTKADSADADITLHSKLKRGDKYTDIADYSSYKNEVDITLPDLSNLCKELISSKDNIEIIEKYAFFTKYLFSCLTDADFLDTERFCSPSIERGLNADFYLAEQALDNKLNGFVADTPLKQARGRLQKQAIDNITDDAQINILNMPTGSGKTLCSLKIALQMLRKHNKKRIIYVIPYTSIIEQTAEIFDGIFGKYVDIVQHHSNYNYEDFTDKNDITVENNTTSDKVKLSTENWDAPLIITTSVQFFQSLYHYKGSGLRKLHNMADSVIIFDEIHTLPITLLQPCLKGIGMVTKYLNSEAIFLSATMPDYSPLFQKFLGEHKVNNLITDKADFKFFQKCNYIPLGKTDIENIVEKASDYNSSLIIVNNRKTARETFDLISGKKYHLSTYMTPYDRSQTIKNIRQDLASGEKITVVSTSLVEAGVDFDFEAVFRQLAGLDNILQSGGRCNRDGKREYGDVYIFDTEQSLAKDLKVRASIVQDMLRENFDITSNESVEEYYRRLFIFKDEEIQRNTIAYDTQHNRFVCGFDNIPFRTYAKNFEFIKDDTIGVVIDNCAETSQLLKQLEYGVKGVRRKLQKYTVNLKIHTEFNEAYKLGLIHDTGYGVLTLSDNSYYNAQTGININLQKDCIY